MGGALLVLSAESHSHRRRLSALAWAAFEEMALRAVADDGWYTVAGVRDIGAFLGVTKDTAARAVAELVSARLASRERLSAPAGARRFAYRLHPPAGVELCPTESDGLACPNKRDTVPRPTDADIERPSHWDARPCPMKSDTALGPNVSDADLGPNEPDTVRRPTESDTSVRIRSSELEPIPVIEGARAASGSGSHAGVPLARATEASSAGDGDTREFADESGAQDGRTVRSHTAMVAVNGRVSADDQNAHRRSRRRGKRAENEAQGQLFEDGVAAKSKDRP